MQGAVHHCRRHTQGNKKQIQRKGLVYIVAQLQVAFYRAD